MRASEKSGVQLLVRQYLQLRGWRVHRLQSDLRPGIGAHNADREEPGTPDLLAWHPDPLRFVYIECKRRGSKPSPVQDLWIWDARKRGITVLVVDSLESLVDQLHEATRQGCAECGAPSPTSCACG
jgi:hypothetical protein